MITNTLFSTKIGAQKYALYSVRKNRVVEGVVVLRKNYENRPTTTMFLYTAGFLGKREYNV